MIRIATVLAVLAAAPAAQAADVACVEVDHPDCTSQVETLADALATGAPVVRLGRGPFEGASGAGPVEIAGSDGTAIRGDLVLTGGAIGLHNARVEGRLELGPGSATLANLDLADLALDGTDLVARHLTVMGGLTADGGTIRLASSVVRRPDPFEVTGGTTVRTVYSAHAADDDASAPDRIDAPADPRSLTGSRLIDAGDPVPLEPFESFEDAAGTPRAADGDADGAVRRDIGAYELQPPIVPVPASSVLVNGGAENGLDGWTGTFTAAGYGDTLLPSRATGAALGGGDRFFSAAVAEQADLFQRVDVTAAAASIDRGLGQAAFSGLIGGYGADADTLAVRAVFKDPENVTLGALELPAVTPADRGNATNLLRRVAAGPIPARTRAIDVLLHAERSAGSYTDAYADNLGLVLSVPGVPVDTPDPGEPPVDDLDPFDGITVLTARPQLTAARQTAFLLACADATVGACRGNLELRAGGRRLAPKAGFLVRPGATREIRMRLSRRHLGPARLIAVAYDGQGLRRRTTVPVTLVALRR